MLDTRSVIDTMQQRMLNKLDSIGMTLGQLNDAYCNIPFKDYCSEPTVVEVVKAFREASLDEEVAEAIAKVKALGYTVTLDNCSTLPRAYRLGLKEGMDMAKTYMMLRAINALPQLPQEGPES